MARFGDTARSTVALAVRAAQRDGSAEIREEHLLVAVLDSADGASALTPLGGGAKRARAFEDIARLRRSGGYTAEQRDALSAFGVDLDEVVSRVESRLGDGVLDEQPSPRSGGPRLSASAVGVIEQAAREAAADGSSRIDVFHLALGLVAAPGVVSDVLGSHGVTVPVVRATIRRNRPESKERGR